LTPARGARWLLIGNSRWHWAERQADGQLHGWDGDPVRRGGDGVAPLAWAAVGALPDPEVCPPERRVGLADVPLRGCPPWLGVDRALAGWEAWRELEEAVLVVDAGTVMSLTRVDGRGAFRGGRLIAGLRLQLEAMAHRTALIGPLLADPPVAQEGRAPNPDDPDWPAATGEAMRVGVEAALAAAVIDAARGADTRVVVFTGGDGRLLRQRTAARLEEQGIAAAHRPLLCLRSLARLRPEG